MQPPATLEWDGLVTAVHGWQSFLDHLPTESLERKCLSWLSPAERIRHKQFKTEKLRQLYLATRTLCRMTLSRYTGVSPAAWKFVKAAHGKPRIAGPAKFKSLRFNLTHTDGLVICVVTRAGEIGVDAEQTSRSVDIPQVVRHFFSAAEQAIFADLPRKQRTTWFLRQWVLKEAYLKGRGMGLALSPDRFTIELDDNGQPLPLGNWRFALHRPSPRHVAAAAIRRQRGAAPVSFNWFVADDLLEACIAVE
ncbi:MAG TPA: 4'-phosphopantetheinyl transferase superfamily protein [Tepidisphaeraceae bacterium]|jgi:4'-phosphopantetheinyl transferase|nr:4'-phosphopantetheinyl transferase superfamily protein [Tepidisphaeraceae bacterium]